MSRRRILYIGMVATKSYLAHSGGSTLVGAAAGKMVAVTAALRIVGRRAFLVSLPFPGPDAERPHLPALATSGDGVPALFLPVSRAPFLRKLRGMWSLAAFAATGVRQSDIVLFYNHALEYLPGLLILRLRGVRVFQDIEDTPIDADTGLRGLLNRIGYRTMFGLSSHRKITVSDQLGRRLGLREYHAVQGVASVATKGYLLDRWEALLDGGPLRIHFGGTLQRSTGIDLFCDALVDLKSRDRSGCMPIVIEVTGMGDLSRIAEISADLPSDVAIRVHGPVSREAYEAIVEQSHVGLSLRLPDEEISWTTFPSKVIEITSQGLALVSTRVSDVEAIFGAEDAYLLSDATPQALGSAILDMARSPEVVALRAEAGRNVTSKRFALQRVGLSLARFLESDEVSAR